MGAASDCIWLQLCAGGMACAYKFCLSDRRAARPRPGTRLQVSAAEGVGMAAEECEALYKQHRSFLAIPHSDALETAFVAMVKDHFNNQLAIQAKQVRLHEPAGAVGSCLGSWTASRGCCEHACRPPPRRCSHHAIAMLAGGYA